MSVKAEGLLNKIKVWFAKPGWIPPMDGKPAYQIKPQEVQPEKYQKYIPEIKPELKRYNLIWFILILLFGFIYLVFHTKLSWSEQIFYSILITFHLLIINGNNESKKWAWYLEILRLISLISLGIYLPLVYVIPLSVLSILSGIYFYFVMNKNIKDVVL
jgi:alkylglycerol monooxygenase